MKRRWHDWRLSAAVLSVAFAWPVAAQDAPPDDSSAAVTEPAPAQPQGLHADELVVLLCDEFSEHYNAEALFDNTLPGFARLSRRPRAGHDQRHRPMPIGVISFTGPPPETLDVLIELDDAEPLYAWPPATTLKDTRVLWTRLTLDRDADAVPQLDEPNHWLDTLRTDDSLIVHANRKAAHALLYDVSLDAENPLKLGREGEAYTAAIEGGAAVRDAFLFKPGEADAVRAVRVAFDENDGAATTAADATHPTRDAALATLTAALRADGVPAHLADLAGATVGRVLEDEEGQMVAVARMREAFLQQHLALEVTPAPAALSRTALVVVINADPDLLGQIDGLIAQLGDSSWTRRHHAHEELAELGEIAKSRLEDNRNHDDPEVAFRVAALLEALNEGDPNKDR
jgi:hypothetical protein